MSFLVRFVRPKLHDIFIYNRYFVKKGAIVDRKGGILHATPLHWAVRYVILLHWCKISDLFVS